MQKLSVVSVGKAESTQRPWVRVTGALAGEDLITVLRSVPGYRGTAITGILNGLSDEVLAKITSAHEIVSDGVRLSVRPDKFTDGEGKERDGINASWTIIESCKVQPKKTAEATFVEA